METQRVPTVWKIWSAIVGAGLVAWFFFTWLWLDKHFFDAVGESVGTAFALLTVASIVGAIRHNPD